MLVVPNMHIPQLRLWEIGREGEGKMRSNFYEALNELNPNRQNVAMTVLEGAHIGEKALFSDHKPAWLSAEGGFFQSYLQMLEEFADEKRMQAIVTVDGVQVFCELLGNEKKFVICGGGHVSIPIIRMGLMIGCRVTVLEDRPKFADHARRAGATEVICEPFEKGLEKIEGDRDTFFIIVTRGHRYDQVCLEQIAKKPHAYIGMIGSRLRVKKVKEALAEKGCDQKILAQIYSPIGLDIGAQTPEEIAVAVLAEIIQVKNKSEHRMGYPKEILRAIADAGIGQETKILATIVARKGSAPRGVGTKMLVLADGSCVGTIGGGCVESDILQKALFMIRDGTTEPKRCHVDMTGQDAEDEGMVCGGVIDVWLEPV